MVKSVVPCVHVSLDNNVFSIVNSLKGNQHREQLERETKPNLLFSTFFCVKSIVNSLKGNKDCVFTIYLHFA
jgi:hypothetical protein